MDFLIAVVCILAASFLALAISFLVYAVVIPVMAHYGDRVARWVEDHLP